LADGQRPQPGAAAPDFELPGTEGEFRLSEHRGERLILLFYPGDNTLVRARQFCSYGDDQEAFLRLGATAVGISSQNVDSLLGLTYQTADDLRAALDSLPAAAASD
jgi:peroxiredoxin